MPKKKLSRWDREQIILTAAEKWVDPDPDDVAIDADAKVSEVDEGFWVQAWVFVSHDDLGGRNWP